MKWNSLMRRSDRAGDRMANPDAPIEDQVEAIKEQIQHPNRRQRRMLAAIQRKLAKEGT